MQGFYPCFQEGNRLGVFVFCFGMCLINQSAILCFLKRKDTSIVLCRHFAWIRETLIGGSGGEDLSVLLNTGSEESNIEWKFLVVSLSWQSPHQTDEFRDYFFTSLTISPSQPGYIGTWGRKSYTHCQLSSPSSLPFCWKNWRTGALVERSGVLYSWPGSKWNTFSPKYFMMIQPWIILDFKQILPVKAGNENVRQYRRCCIKDSSSKAGTQLDSLIFVSHDSSYRSPPLPIKCKALKL